LNGLFSSTEPEQTAATRSLGLSRLGGIAKDFFFKGARILPSRIAFWVVLSFSPSVLATSAGAAPPARHSSISLTTSSTTPRRRS
jgi:hypothetical protein